MLTKESSVNTSTPALISLDQTPASAAPAATGEPAGSSSKKRGMIIGSVAVLGCAIACSVPLLLGAGAISLSAGAIGGEQAFFAVALVSLGVVAGVVWFRRRRAAKAAALRAATAHATGTAVTADACSTDHGCAGSGCGCS